MNPDTLNALDTVIGEGNTIEGFLASDAWAILKKTINAQIANYKEDCYDAAKSTGKNIAAFLGRMEALEWIVNCVEHDFIDARNKALVEKQTAEELTREEEEINRGVSEGIGNQVFHKPGTI